MTPLEAAQAKADGVNATVHKWITKIETEWERQLGTGRDYFRITGLDEETEEVQDLVVRHFVKLGYGFQMEQYRGSWDDYEAYCMRITPLAVPKKERGVFSRLLTRLFGGSHA